jgi:hypothetical protein
MGNNIVVVLLVHFVLVKICHIMTQRGFMLYTTIHTQTDYLSSSLNLSRRDCMVVEFTTTCAIVAYHHLCCEFEPHAWRGVLDKTLCDKSFSVMCITVPTIVWETILL